MSQYHRENPDAPIKHEWFEGARQHAGVDLGSGKDFSAVQIYDEQLTLESKTETELWTPDEDMKILNFHVGAASSVFYKLMRRIKVQAIRPTSETPSPKPDVDLTKFTDQQIRQMFRDVSNECERRFIRPIVDDTPLPEGVHVGTDPGSQPVELPKTFEQFKYELRDEYHTFDRAQVDFDMIEQHDPALLENWIVPASLEDVHVGHDPVTGEQQFLVEVKIQPQLPSNGFVLKAEDG
jgi:hypothetical protein